MDNKILNLKNRREFFWDNYVVDTERTTASLLLHHPQYRDNVIEHNETWEGSSVSYRNILKDGDIYRMYYLTRQWRMPVEKYESEPGRRICYAESKDGINWTKPKLGLRKYHGSYDNNIILDFHDNDFDNFYVFIDPNNTQNKYKGIGIYRVPGKNAPELWYWESNDGLNFQLGGKITDKGAFDTMNTVHYDEERKRYVCYIRGYHDPGTIHNEFSEQIENNGHSIRDIRVLYSKDFKEWTEPKLIKVYDENGDIGDDYPVYTNCAQKYYRGEHVVVGFPTRYVEHPEWYENFDRLCGRELRRTKMEWYSPRAGLAITDCVFMLSRDDEKWTRYDDAFLRPGPESADDWIYGSCYPADGLLETKGPFPNCDNEISFYLGSRHMGDSYETLRRYVLRVDGFVSRHAGYKKAKIVTKKFTFEGDTLELNFSTSAIGYLYVRLKDEDDNEISSKKIFGDKVDRIIDFDGLVSEFSGKAITMEIEMCDADVYSFRFFKK